MKPIAATLSILLFMGILNETKAQGCSDAGVCTAGPIGELVAIMDSTSVDHSHYARLIFSYAVGEQNTSILQGVAEVGIGITERLGVQAKLPYFSASGNLGSNSGVGDPVITASYVLSKRANTQLEGMLGVKIPVNDANAQVDDKALPMPYQTSLGTTDLLLGLNYRWARWSFGLAYQHILSNRNENQFSHALWMDDMDALGYFESAFLDRADDAVVRLQYRIPIGGSFLVQPGLLAIVHMEEDMTTEFGMSELEREAVAGSDGLTLNLTIDARWAINDRWAVELAYGSPLITRDVRPDGLTRSMVLNTGLRYSF